MLLKKYKYTFLLTRKRLKQLKWEVKSITNKYFLLNSLISKSNGLHIGCGDIKINGFINIDARATTATDITYNSSKLSIFPDKTFSILFSNAFFEHLYKNQRVEHMKEVFRILKKGGMFLYLGMPDFKVVIDAYLSKSPGILFPQFNLNEVYRYTHGNPEQAEGWWLEQLHKSLFDRETIIQILESSGFKHYIVFDYSFRDEKIALNIGVLGFKHKPKNTINTTWLKILIEKYSNDVNLNSIKIIAKKI